jgi:hypothetical protein
LRCDAPFQTHREVEVGFINMDDSGSVETNVIGIFEEDGIDDDMSTLFLVHN